MLTISSGTRRFIITSVACWYIELFISLYRKRGRAWGTPIQMQMRRHMDFAVLLLLAVAVTLAGQSKHYLFFPSLNFTNFNCQYCHMWDFTSTITSSSAERRSPQNIQLEYHLSPATLVRSSPAETYTSTTIICMQMVEIGIQQARTIMVTTQSFEVDSSVDCVRSQSKGTLCRARIL